MNAPQNAEGAGLLQRARALLVRTMTFYRDDPRTSSWLRGRLERLDQPLRIAVTGRVKSGKSTLINALVGQQLAPSDTEESTQVNTFYQYGPEPKITVHTPHGTVQNVPVTTLDPSSRSTTRCTAKVATTSPNSRRSNVSAAAGALTVGFRTA